MPETQTTTVVEVPVSWKWLAGFLVTILLAGSSFFFSSIDVAVKNLSKNLSEIKVLIVEVQGELKSQREAATFRMLMLQDHENRIRALEGRAPRK